MRERLQWHNSNALSILPSLQLGLFLGMAALGAVAGANAVQSAATARADLQASINTLAPSVATFTGGVSTAETLLTAAEATRSNLTDQFDKICPAIKDAGDVTLIDLTTADDAAVKTALDSLQAAFNNNNCP